MKKIYTFIFLLSVLGTFLAFLPSKSEAATTSAWVAPYGYVLVTANHYNRQGQWQAEGTNTLISVAQQIAAVAIASGGSYVTNYACGNRDVVSVQCSGGYTCSGENSYYITNSCSLSLVGECSNGCMNGTCKPIPEGSPETPVVQATTSDVCGGKIRLTWNNAARATSYRVFRSTSAAGTFTEIDNSPTSLTDFTDTPGQGTFYYKVKAINNAGSSAYSTVVSAAASKYCPPLAKPTTISASPSAQCGGKIDISWAPVAGAAGYNVYRWTTDNASYYNNSYMKQYRLAYPDPSEYSKFFPFYGSNGLITPSGTTGTTFTDKPGQGTFYYTVAAYPRAGDNKYDMGPMVEPAVKSTPSQKCPPPTAPQNLRVQSTCGGKASLTWDKSNGAETYILQRSKASKIEYVTVGKPNTTSYTDNPGNGIYLYRVIAEGDSQQSSPSEAITVDTSPVCPAGEPISMTLKAVPSIVQKGQTCSIEWTVSDSTSCKLTGTNGDTFSFNPKEANKFISSPIQSRTIYNLTCTNPKYTTTKSVSCSINPSQTEI